MTLKAVLGKLEDVEEAHRALYTEKTDNEGKTWFVLDVDEASIREHPTVTALKNALDRQKTAAAELKTKLEAVEVKVKSLPDDFTAEEWARLKAIEDSDHEPDTRRSKAAAEASKVFEQRIDKLKSDHAKSEAQKDAALAAEKIKVQRLVVGQGLEEAMTGVNVKPEFRKAVRALLRDKVKVVETDESDVPIAVVETEMDPGMPLAKYAESWAQTDEGKIYIGTPVGGGGGGGGDLRKGEKNPWTKDGWNMTEQGRIFRADPAKAERLAKAAGRHIGAAA
jgi:hypothetical protein